MSAAGGGAWGSARQDAHAERENSCAGQPLLTAAMHDRPAHGSNMIHVVRPQPLECA